MFKRKLNGKVTQAELDGDVFIGVELSPDEKKEAARLLAGVAERMVHQGCSRCLLFLTLAAASAQPRPDQAGHRRRRGCKDCH